MRKGVTFFFLIFPGLFFLTTFAVPPAVAASSEKIDFFDLDLSELSNVIVTVASTKEETIAATPAIVSRYNADEMAMLGLRNLKDMLSFIPGVVVQDSFIGTSPIMIRGLVEAFNQKILFLIDDVPYFQPGHSDIPLSGVPIEAIDHIEVIRGPGAVYYGTNATAGVIKVVTKQAQESHLALSTGSNQLINTGGYWRYRVNGNVDFTLAFESQDEDGYDATFYNMPGPPPGTPVSGTVTKKERKNSVLTKLSVADINFLGQAYKSKVSGVNDHGVGVNRGGAEYEGYLIHLDHKRQLIGADIKIYSDYNVFHPTIEGEHFYPAVTLGGVRFGENGRDNSRLRSGGTIEYPIYQNLTIFGGGEYERRSTGYFTKYDALTDQEVAANIIEENKMSEKSLFSQLDYNYASWRFLVGGRFTSNTQSGDELTPRGSAIYKVDEHQSIKLLAAKGFNSPNFIQQGANASGLVSSAPDLVAETIETVDLAYTFNGHNNLFVVNAYFIEAERVIERKKTAGIITFSNANNFQRYGAELDYQYGTKQWKFFSNLAYHAQGDEDISDDEMAKFTPRLTASLGGFFRIGEHHNLGSSLRIVGERMRAKTINLMNIDYQYHKDNLELFATVRNLFDQEPLNPDVGNFSEDPLIPGGDRINFLVGAKYTYY